MNIETKSTGGARSLLEKIPYLIPAIIIIIILADYFVAHGSTEGTTLISWYSYTYPLLLPIGVITLLMSNSRYIMDRRPGWIYFLVSVLGFAATFLFTLTTAKREASPEYLQIYDLVILTGTSSIIGCQLLTTFKPLMSGFVIRSRFSAWLVFFIALATVTISPLGDTISPALGNFGRFFQQYMVPAADQGYYIVMNMAQIILLVRVLLLQEKLSPARA